MNEIESKFIRMQTNISHITDGLINLEHKVSIHDSMIEKNRNDLAKFMSLTMSTGKMTTASIDKINDEIMQLNKEYATIKAIGIFVAVILIAILIMLGLALFLKF
jgi:hypothetical protein